MAVCTAQLWQWHTACIVALPCMLARCHLVHEGLREAGLVNLVVAVPPVADQVDEDVALEPAHAPGRCATAVWMQCPMHDLDGAARTVRGCWARSCSYGPCSPTPEPWRGSAMPVHVDPAHPCVGVDCLHSLGTPLSRQLAHAHHALHIISIHVEDGRIEGLGDVCAVRRGARLGRVRGEGHLHGTHLARSLAAVPAGCELGCCRGMAFAGHVRSFPGIEAEAAGFG